jgi:hypothetical protein
MMALNSLQYQGQTINERDDMLSLTDMWRAAGGTDNKRPVDWLRSPSTSEFVEHISGVVGKSHDDLIQTLRGNDAGTWAHWQIGLAYAKYLSPEFHAWCNEIVKAHMEGRHVPVQAAPAVFAMDEHFAEALARAMQPLVDSLRTTHAQTSARLGGVEAEVGEVRHDVRSLKTDVACLRSEVFGLTNRGRRRIKDSTRGEIVRHTALMGGRCPCCGQRDVVCDGRPTDHAEFDHFYQNSAPDAEHVWLICAPCHAELTRHVAARDTRSTEFQAFQRKRRRLPGAQLSLLTGGRA